VVINKSEANRLGRLATSRAQAQVAFALSFAGGTEASVDLAVELDIAEDTFYAYLDSLTEDEDKDED
jgi:hypothetical protein